MNEQKSMEQQEQGSNQQKKKNNYIKCFELDEFKKDCQADLNPAFSPQTFNSLQFANGTINYIGARTGTGKTMSLVSLANEALESQEQRTVLFYSLEESIAAIAKRLILCNAYLMETDNRSELEQITKPFSLLSEVIAEKDKNSFLNKAYKQVMTFISNKNLSIRKPYKASLETIVNDIETNANEGNIVLIDYIQKMPDYESLTRTDLYRIAAASGALAELAIEKKCIIIAAAQINREGSKNKEITENDFRGCGDLEQDGENLIVIDYEERDNARDYFFKVLKARREQAGKETPLIFKGAFSFLQASKEQGSNQQKKKKTTFADKGIY